ncbi:hypothetical protein OHA57_40055 (plasmid) [Streptomyces anulatus]|uniref:hypothetical protein n=1 Tax=Streptomyces anulatus TaxID=1892 RepID=UPI002DD938AC|nr:hypothetical protein [Streptomyces anulatus]WSC66933.1 hypothetical protein OHA57_40055 [Streptomyces anulatus]WTC68748.1 hypothetical protein OG865_40135 [Streptomyces anulatus]WTC76391.1 hypothetical protein OG882_39065 [Streptomyces anulatus]
MPRQHGPRRARITFSDAATKQVEAITSEAELHALDRALVVISVDPEAGEPIPGGPTGPRLREYTDAIERVRLLYWTSALGTIVVVAYIEV